MRAGELDSELAAVVDEVDSLGLPEWHELSVDAARRVEDEVFSGDQKPAVADVRDLSFDGPHGDVPVRVYRPEAAVEASVGGRNEGGEDEEGGEGDERGTRTLVHFHGGGWTLGTLDSIDGPCRELATRADAVVISVDYRLAPEHPFPVAVDEAAAAVEWAAENAATFGGSPDRLGVSGTSAGATLAFAACLHACEFDEPPEPAAQFLLYPIAGDDFETESYRENADGPLLTRADMRWFFEQYLRSPVDAHNPFAVPLRADDLGGLPPATVVTAGFDPLRDDGVALAERFANEGTPVEHRHYPAMAHGFCSLADRVAVAEEALSSVVGDVRERL
jgi:acetyl esterase